MLPLIERQSYMPEFYQHVEELLREGVACFLARSFESAAHLMRLGFAKLTILDAGVYTWNAEALMWAEENGFIEVTAPYELNKKELRRLFIDWKMPESARNRWPIIVNKDGIIVYVPRYQKDFVAPENCNFRVKY